MTEAEILNQFNLSEERLWVLLQWWAGVSIGLIAVAHVSARRFNLALLSITLLIYVSYSIVIFSLLASLAVRMDAGVQDLRALSADELSITSRVLTESWGSGSGIRLVTMSLSVVGTFLAGVSYPIYCFFSERSKRRLASKESAPMESAPTE